MLTDNGDVDWGGRVAMFAICEHLLRTLQLTRGHERPAARHCSEKQCNLHRDQTVALQSNCVLALSLHGWCCRQQTALHARLSASTRVQPKRLHQ